MPSSRWRTTTTTSDQVSGSIRLIFLKISHGILGNAVCCSDFNVRGKTRCRSLCSSSRRGLLAAAEPGRVQGGGLGRGLLPLHASVPRGNGAAANDLRLHADPNARGEAGGDPGQRREGPSGPAAASPRSEAPKAPGQHQSHQPAQGAAAAAAAAGPVHRGQESMSDLWEQQLGPEKY